MSFIFKCNDCGRGFTTKQLEKSGLNKMFKQQYIAPVTSTLSAGAYSLHPVMVCPYCLSKNTGHTTESARVSMLIGKINGSYPKPDRMRYEYLQLLQCFKDCFVNANLNTGEVFGMNGDGERLIKEALDESSDIQTVINKLSNEFIRPIIIHDKANDSYFVKKKEKTIFAARFNPESGEYDISDNGNDFISYSSDPDRVKKIVRAGAKVIGDYSSFIEI